MDPEILSFPKDFKFGTSVASFQVEGNLGQRNSDWDIFLAKHPNIVKPNEIGPQWWDLQHAESDISQIASLGVRSQRLSFEWARIEPEEGKINRESLHKYRQLIDFLHKHKIEPIVTLNHYTLPDWIAKKGSWNNAETISAFKRYTQLIASEFGDVKTWLTLNEPNVMIEIGYLVPVFPPQRIGLYSALNARKHMLEAHRQSYAVIKQNIPHSQVSMAFAFRWYRPQNKKSAVEKYYAGFANYVDSLNYIEAVKDTLDFIGLNFYTGYFLRVNPFKFSFHIPTFHGEPPKTILFGEVRKPGAYVSDTGMPIVPGFFLDIFRVLHARFGKPILVTENGIADRRDLHRAFYILVHLTALWKALQEGINIQQYMVWSTVDNIEWREGYKEEFGLIHVNAVTGKREMRKSANLYRDIIHANAIHLKPLFNTYLNEIQQNTAKELIHHLLHVHKTPSEWTKKHK